MKSAENRASHNDAMRLRWAGYRRLQIQRAVRSVSVVVTEELGEQREQMLLIQHDDVVKTLLAKGPHYPFRDRVRQRRPVGRFVVFDANAGELAPEVSTVRVVPITDQVSRLTAPAGGFDHLPPDPARRRARGDLALNQLPALVADEEEHIKGLEADRLHHEQVRRPDALDLIPQKRFPGLTSLRLGTPPSIAANRSIADHDRQLEEFSADALGAPQRIFPRHSSNQFPDFCAQASPTQPTPRPPAPVQAPTPAMPADYRLRLHDPQLTSPSLRPEPPHPDPKDPIPVPQTRLWLAAQEDLELVAQDQVLERKVLAGTTAINQDTKRHREEAQHRRGSISGQGAPRRGRSEIDFCRPTARPATSGSSCRSRSSTWT